MTSFLKVLKSDVARTPLPWVAELGERIIEKLVKQAIGRSPEQVQKMLKNTELEIVPLPSVDQVLGELDPRQSVFAEGVDVDTGSFERLWVFYKNFEYAGITPNCNDEVLAEVIEDAVCHTRR